MPGTQELMARLQQLEDGYYGDKENARRSQFFDTYGSRWSNNHGLGMAILNELDARGIDTSAADEAVQDILNTLRTECQEILDLTKGIQDAAIKNQEKLETISTVVDQQVAENPDATNMQTADIEIPSPSEIPALEGQADTDDFISQFDLGGEAPAEGGEVPAEGGEMPVDDLPEEGGEMPPEEIPEDQTMSDRRMKLVSGIKARQSSRGSGVYKPSPEILANAMRGF